jgi:hypothetical protein
MLRLLDSHCKSCHFLVSRNHLFAIFTEHPLLNSQELRPHEESILVGAHLLKKVSKDGDNLLQKWMIDICFTILNLLLKCVLERHFNSKNAFAGCLAHQNHRVY